MPNVLFREEAKRSNVKHWEVADAIGMHDSNFCRKLRKELPAHEQAKLINIVHEIAANRKREG